MNCPLHHILWPLIVVTSTVQAGDVYKWVDDNGRTHYGDTPPDETASAVEIETGKPSVSPHLQERRKKRGKLLQQFAEERRQEAEAAEKLAAEKAERERQCKRTRNQLRQYEHSPYLYETNEDGERRILNDAERAAEQERLRQFLQEHCQ